jgi:transcription initiation factor TFIIIB Brf1 subunit/transcription initiation factor TFIIB
MAMPVCTSWLWWLWPRHERSKSTAQQVVDEERLGRTSLGLVDSDSVSAKPGDFENIVKRISAEFDVSDDDIQRITSGFVNQLSKLDSGDSHVCLLANCGK